MLGHLRCRERDGAEDAARCGRHSTTPRPPIVTLPGPECWRERSPHPWVFQWFQRCTASDQRPPCLAQAVRSAGLPLAARQCSAQGCPVPRQSQLLDPKIGGGSQLTPAPHHRARERVRSAGGIPPSARRSLRLARFPTGWLCRPILTEPGNRFAPQQGGSGPQGVGLRLLQRSLISPCTQRRLRERR